MSETTPEETAGDSYEEALAEEQEAQRKAARDGTESIDPAEGVRADRAEKEAEAAQETS